MSHWMEMFGRLWQGRHKIIVATLTAGVLAALFSLITKPTYRAQAVFIPLTRSGGGLGSLIPQAGSGGIILNMIGDSLGGGQEQKLMVLLKSRTLAEGVIKKLDLGSLFLGGKPVESPFDMQEAVQQLQRKVSFEKRREGYYSVSADFPDRDLAANVANTYLGELQKVINSSSFTLAKKNRLFVEEQMKSVEDDLRKAENGLRAFQEEHGVISLDSQTEYSLKTLAEIEGAIISKDLEMASLAQISTPGNPDLQRLREEKKVFENKLKSLRAPQVFKPGRQGKDKQLMISVEGAPEMGLDFLRLKREVLIKEKTFELLTQQHQIARIEEVKDDVSFQVVDPAIPPKYRLRPKRTLNTVVGLLAGFVVSATWILVGPTPIRKRKFDGSLQAVDVR